MAVDGLVQQGVEGVGVPRLPRLEALEGGWGGQRTGRARQASGRRPRDACYAAGTQVSPDN